MEYNMNGRDESPKAVPLTGTAGARGYRTGRSRKLVLTMMACLSGGTMFTTCQSRLRDATVQASKDLLASLLDPAAIVDALFGTDSSTGG